MYKSSLCDNFYSNDPVSPASHVSPGFPDSQRWLYICRQGLDLPGRSQHLGGRCRGLRRGRLGLHGDKKLLRERYDRDPIDMIG